MGAVRLVTPVVGHVAGVDGLSVGGHVGHGALDDGHRAAVRAGLQVAHLLLFDSVFGLETETQNNNNEPSKVSCEKRGN